MKHAERFGLDVPDDFPLDAIEAIHAHLHDRDRRPPEWASAANGLMWRFRACDEHGAALVESLRASVAPPSEDRYHQEKWLFGFFTEGLSAIECLYYGLYFIGALANPQMFDTEINRHRIKPRFVAAKFAAAFPCEDLSTRLGEVDTGEEITLWRGVRNVLVHQGAPGRHHFLGREPSLWGLSEAASRLLEPEQISTRRERVGAAVVAIAEAAVPFVQAQVQ